MSSEVFVWVNLGIGFLLILLVWVGKRGALKPSSLNLRRGGADADLRKPTTTSKNAAKSDVHFHSKPQDPAEVKMKNLNVIFMFNGHSFDAYEVLGVPAGANLEMTEKAYRKIIKNKPSDSEFFNAAWAAIKHDRS